MGANKSLHPDAATAEAYFCKLRASFGDSDSDVCPTLYFALANAPDTAVAKGVARNDDSGAIGGVAYKGTVESLVAGFSAILSKNGITPTALSYPPPADVLGTTGVEWDNSSDVPWREVDVLTMGTGGLKDSTYESALTARVSGPGMFVFTYDTASAHKLNAFSFFVDGIQQFSLSCDGNDSHQSDEPKTITNVVTSAAGATFTWKYAVNNAAYDDSSCGAWIGDVHWIPESVTRTDGSGNEIQIPASWFTQHGLVSSGATAKALAAAADADSDGDGMSNWTEYVCGTDPNDADERLHCTISFADGSPVIDYAPKDSYLSGYRAVLKGKASLSDSQWTDAAPGHRFFKVVVEKE